MVIPAELADAIRHPDGGRVVLILGAGCSREPPTNLELASYYAERVHQKLIDDGILSSGSCPDPYDLSSVADAVWAARGRQRDLVERLPQADFARAEPNEGHLIAAAMLAEHTVIAVLSLNFDLSMSHALQQLEVRSVPEIQGPADYAILGVVNLVYLHRNVRADPEDWVLRTAALIDEWQGSWREAFAQRFLNTPVRVFVGLGTPAGVLVETTRRIRAMVPAAGALVYQVDVVQRHESDFAAALDIPDAAYLQSSWCDFMREIGDYLVDAQAERLAAACEELTSDNEWPVEDVNGLRGKVATLGLIPFGGLRARWMLESRMYLPLREVDPRLLADVLLAVGFIERHLGAQGAITADGVVEFWGAGRLVSSVVLASGRGTKPWLRLDHEIRQQARQWAYRNPRPRFVVVTAVLGARPGAVSPPENLAVEVEPESILLGDVPFDFRMVSLYELRNNPGLLADIIG